MSKPRVIYMGTPDFAVPCLEMLCNRDYDIVGIVTQPDRPKGRGQKLAFSPVKETALKYDLPVYQPERVKTDDFVETLKKLHPDIIVVVAFGQILPKAILDIPQFGCINVHASLLPSLRGAAPIHWAIINGYNVSGVTTMFMDVGLDTGDMILKASTPITDTMTTGELHDLLKHLGASVLDETLRLILSGTAPRIPQDHDKATYAPMLTKDIERIRWNCTSVDIHNLIRGLNPWPGAFCHHNGKLLKLWSTRIHDEIYSDTSDNTAAGSVLAFTKQGFVVKTGRGCIEILEVQPESKRRMSALDYAYGNGLALGDLLL